MTDRPFLLSGPMVRALLDGRKTQTRRVLPYGVEGSPVEFRRGDRLWVREAWRTACAYDDIPPRDMGGEEPVRFEADGTLQSHGWTAKDWRSGRHRVGMHMPRWASRLTLTVTDVRVQRVQEISEDDARAEGVQGNATGTWGCEGLIEDFSELWDSLNAPRGYGWDANPWVVALTFTATATAP